MRTKKDEILLLKLGSLIYMIEGKSRTVSPRSSIDSVIGYLRVLIVYQKFDLEATNRELDRALGRK